MSMSSEVKTESATESIEGTTVDLDAQSGIQPVGGVEDRDDLDDFEQFVFAHLTVTPQEASEAELDKLRDAGLREDELLEIVQIVAIFNATNRLNAGLGVKVDGGAFVAFRS